MFTFYKTILPTKISNTIRIIMPFSHQATSIILVIFPVRRRLKASAMILPFFGFAAKKKKKIPHSGRQNKFY